MTIARAACALVFALLAGGPVVAEPGFPTVQTAAREAGTLYLTPALDRPYMQFPAGQPFTVTAVEGDMCHVGAAAPAYVLCAILVPPPGGWPTTQPRPATDMQTEPDRPAPEGRPDETAMRPAFPIQPRPLPADATEHALPAPDGRPDETAMRPAVPVPTRPEREIIADVQRELNRIGCSAGTPDGVAGARTKRALKRFLDIIGATHDPEVVANETVLVELQRTPDPVCTARWLLANNPKALEGSWGFRTDCKALFAVFRTNGTAYVTMQSNGTFRGRLKDRRGRTGTSVIERRGNAVLDSSRWGDGTTVSVMLYPSSSSLTFSGTDERGCKHVIWKY